MEPNAPMVLYNVAGIFSLAGRIGEVLGYVEASVDNGTRLRRWLEHDSNLDAIHDTRRFRAVMDRL